MGLTEFRTALLMGASGLVGGHCLEYLLAASCYTQVNVLVRKSLGIDHPKLIEHIIDFEKLGDDADLFQVNDVLSCLGVKGALSAYEFEQVEYGYPVTAAKAACKKGADQFLVVTAMGASPWAPSALFKYKGRLEKALKQIPLKGLHIFRPSLIVGDRQTRRPDEEALYQLFRKITFIIKPLRKWLYIHGQTIAFTMVQTASQGRTGIHIYNTNKILADYNRRQNNFSC